MFFSPKWTAFMFFLSFLCFLPLTLVLHPPHLNFSLSAPSSPSYLSSRGQRSDGGQWASLAKFPQLAEIIYPDFCLYTYLLLCMGITFQDPQWMPLPGWEPPDRSRASNYYSVQPLYRSTPLSSVFIIRHVLSTWRALSANILLA